MSLVLYTPPIINHVAAHTVEIKGSVNKCVHIGQSGKGTGKILWPAAELLSRYIAEPSSGHVFAAAVSRSTEPYIEGTWSWERKNVLELGSGLGLVTTTLLLLGCTVLATDGEQTVVDQLNINLNLNADTVVEARGGMMYKGMTYWWGSEISALTAGLHSIYSEQAKAPSSENMTKPSPIFDVIVASDVVYGSDPSVWELLLSSIVQLTQQSEKAVLVLIAQTERYKESEDTFYARAAELLSLVDVIDISGYATSCMLAGMKSKTRLYVMTSCPQRHLSSSADPSPRGVPSP